MTQPQHTTTGWTDRPSLVRTATAGLAVGGAVATWAFAAHVLGIDIRSPEMGGTAPADITAAQVAIASLAASLAAWALLAALERIASRARRSWGITAGAVLVLSLGAPLTGAGISGADRASLALLHLVVAAILIPGMLHSTRSDESRLDPTRADRDEKVEA